ncbi:MAG: inositol monophosphatase [Deltaproteobacteria bacterium]|nr:inositol monophosphatase [Deltaproteobacteria bacterium]
MLDAARAAVRAAATLLRGATAADIRAKGTPRDLVTEWDLRSEDCIREVLAPTGIAVLGEEGGETGATGQGQGGARWLVDPIDGTVNFSHGLPIWSISIALETAAGIELGIVYAPELGWWFEAEAGKGARDDAGRAYRVSAIARLESAILSTGFPYDLATSPDNNFAEWDHLQRVAGACRRLGCASLDLCLVAAGRLDGYWERKLKPWDVAAGALIVREAGGTVTNTRGGAFDPHSGEAVATNGAIHEELVAELTRVRP